MVHLRIVVPSHNAEHALDLLHAMHSVSNHQRRRREHLHEAGAGGRGPSSWHESQGDEGRRGVAAQLESRVLPVNLAIVVAAFAAGVGVAELFGAKNLGTAFGVGELTFVLGLVYVLMRR